MKTKTKTKSKINVGVGTLDDLFNKINQEQPIVPVSNKKTSVPTPAPKVASPDQTRAKTARVTVSPEMIDKLSSVDLSAPDDISDAQARQTAGVGTIPTRPQNLPAVINKHLVAAGSIEPEWHMVQNLPGYLASGIRSIGRAVFAPFTKTSIEQIQVLANLGGSGPNDEREINAVAAFLQKNGKRDTEAELEFNERIPGYNANLKIYKALGYTFMLVKDFAGNYIYSWPSVDEHALSDQTKSPFPSLESVSFKQFLTLESFGFSKRKV